jgi:hypothetical protein
MGRVRIGDLTGGGCMIMIAGIGKSTCRATGVRCTGDGVGMPRRWGRAAAVGVDGDSFAEGLADGRAIRMRSA